MPVPAAASDNTEMLPVANATARAALLRIANITARAV
jgi:hypothetical protein